MNTLIKKFTNRHSKLNFWKWRERNAKNYLTDDAARTIRETSFTSRTPGIFLRFAHTGLKMKKSLKLKSVILQIILQNVK